MLSALLAGALVAAASLVCGQALMLAAGRERFSPVAPAAGLSALLVVCGIAVKLPGHGTTAALAAAAAVGAAGWYVWPERERLGEIHWGAVAAVALAALVVSIPFATSGRVGILGQGLVNDDMASHLLFAEWIDTREGPTPDLISDGYPLGPHAVASAASKASGASLIEAFAGLTGAIAVLAALTAYGALGGVRDRFRVPAAALAAMPYLGAAYLAQGAFKEPMLALALVGFGLSLPALRDSWRGYSPTLASTLPDRGRSWMKGQARMAIPMGAIAAGTIYNYSFPGLAWLAITAVAWALTVAWLERDKREGMQIEARFRWSRPLLIAGVAIPVIAAIPELIRIASFAGFEAFSPSGEGGNTGFGNLRQALNPLEAFGVWPSSEFRISAANSSTPALAFYLGGLLGLGAFAWGLGRALARREAALPAALLACALGYLVAVAVGTPYTSAKALAIAAPVVMLVALRGLLAADAIEGESERGEAAWWPPEVLRPHLKWGIPALAGAFALAAAFSTLLPLRQSAVGPVENSEELISEIRPRLDGEDVLFLGRDNFISWELLGSEVYSPILNHYDTEEIATLYRATPINAKFDWDNVPPSELERFDWVLTTRQVFASEAPPEFEVARETEDYVLWRRAGAPTPRRTLHERRFPGAPVNCAEPDVAGLARLPGRASVFRESPVLAEDWTPTAEPTDGRPTSQLVSLPPGSWALDLQYASSQELEVTVGGDRITLPPNLLFRGPAPHTPLTTVKSVPPQRSEFEVAVRVGEPPLAGRILGTESRAYLGTLAATPVTAAGRSPTVASREQVPLARACGTYLDWYSIPAGSEPADEGAEAPSVQPPEGSE